MSPDLIESKEAWHRVQASLPIREKVRILLELQRQDLPLIEKQRPLRAWEKPWPVDPWAFLGQSVLTCPCRIDSRDVT